ncbi:MULTISPECIES: ArsR/SmtB family transcription factor [Sulfitobacter]|jgi:DNA-binding transcriptional ArsR family regulator|uniref:Winged helix-turn-helix transcriptional regulator n=1 Tax=Sulfitobacter geojensis TaxID=1342299 RepID=A0AAE2W1I4_9RHOB|nr:metalloregulator ArsR/SmtB family transcription factor [Sulfitobacter geojensis]MBM1691432.1 winged helix-turn-helix transcriptional regulator [Sulfitobacter geojensis]MBM1695498.1 winged helix-turn-helix transcriptional regulator [Sulfitobacter geojensis]MBM1707686.1 winged helix-turn-helix transcriptional regulator [Sulfitobacter geojensis]MBM1711748.1 winged helix-turn-helix transcriptional regulator [Sulfitobacter geojensis]MBM1715811.1 winged helix-turn-helix transcriptional regulator |tara:strand:- start:110 stop:454 length:345 start_codon:yes stop_codon:yes gene_type:complete
MTQIVADHKTATIEQRAKLFRGFADPSRLAILGALCGGPLVVHELVERTGLSQPNVSNHLRCLLKCGLVKSDRNGRFVRYRISSARIAMLLSDVDELLDVVAEGVEACDNYRGR